MKVNGPLFSQSASGTIANAITFSNRKSGQQVRFQRRQKDVATPLRTIQRNKFLNAVDRWNYKNYGIASAGFSFYGVDPTGFERKGTKEKMTGFNFFIKNFLISGE